MIAQLTIGGEPEPWQRAGFALADDALRAGSVPIALRAGKGLLGWRVTETDSEIDGLPVSATLDLGSAPAEHPNGVSRIDHLVVFTPELERTTAAFEEIGVECRRVREVDTEGGRLRQAFFRLGEVIVEVVSPTKVEPGPARFWGITFAVRDLDAAADLLGERLGTIRDAVQPGRRIATLRREAGLGLPVALISEP